MILTSKKIGLQISEVLLGMLRRSSIDPRKVENALRHRARAAGPTKLWPLEYHPRAVLKATGCEISIRAARGAMLVEYDLGEGASYVERGRTACRLRIPRAIAETLALAAIGRTVDELIDLGSHARFLGKCRIRSVVIQGTENSVIDLAPAWHPLS